MRRLPGGIGRSPIPAKACPANRRAELARQTVTGTPAGACLAAAASAFSKSASVNP
jgi:hypothetical protein